MKFRSAWLAAGTTTLTTAALIAAGGVASADVAAGGWDHTWTATGVSVHVDEKGDIAAVCDTKKNGYPGFVEFSYDNLRWPIQTTIDNGCKQKDLDFPEGKTIHLVFQGGGATGSGKFLNDH